MLLRQTAAMTQHCSFNNHRRSSRALLFLISSVVLIATPSIPSAKALLVEEDAQGASRLLPQSTKATTKKEKHGDYDNYKSSLMERSDASSLASFHLQEEEDVSFELLLDPAAQEPSERLLEDLLASLNPSETDSLTESPSSDMDSLLASLSGMPTAVPSQEPTLSPTLSYRPSSFPSNIPTLSPTVSIQPSQKPSISLRPSISSRPSDMPSDIPSSYPTPIEWIDRGDFEESEELIPDFTTEEPTLSPRQSPSALPTESSAPSQFPSDFPSQMPTYSVMPSDLPSSLPSDQPSANPTMSPKPSMKPSLSMIPSASPSASPSSLPSQSPSAVPSSTPSAQPSQTPSDIPTSTPSNRPSSTPSVSPTLECHDEPDYRSPINGFRCRDHQGTSCLQWRFLGLSLDHLEDLITSCPVSCEIDCDTLLRFDITISYQISKVPGLLDALTVADLNAITREYLSDFVRVKQPTKQFFLDNVELLSQTVISRKARNSIEREPNNNNNKAVGSERALADQFVNLWVDVAFSGFAIELSLDETTKSLVSGIDSLGYSAAIRNSGNAYLDEAYAFSAEERTNSSTKPVIDENTDDDNSTSGVLVVFVVVFVIIGAFAAGACLYHKRSVNGLPCRAFKSRKFVERDVQSPESVNVASPVGSMFSYDDTATAGTNGLMRFISSFSRSHDDSTSPSSTAQKSTSNDEEDGISHDEEAGGLLQTPKIEDIREEEEDDEDEEDEHPLAGLIPPMIVYDHIDNEEGVEDEDVEAPVKHSKWGPSVVPSRRVEASQSFKTVLGNRSRPSATDQLAEYLSETSNFVKDPSKLRWMRRLESKRPSPIGIMMDSDEDDMDDDDVSVASTPVTRLQESDLDAQPLRRTRSLDDCSILESVSDIILSEHDYDANVSPIEHPGNTGKITTESPSTRFRSMASLPLMPSDSPTAHDMSPDGDPASFTWVRGRAKEAPDTPTTLRRSSSQSQGKRSKFNTTTQEPAGVKNSFWNRSPIAKGMKDAIWSTKRSSTPTRRPETMLLKKNSLPVTPGRLDMHTRGSSSGNPVTPTRSDLHFRRGSSGAPVTPNQRSDFSTKRSSTPTRLEMMGRRIPTPTRETLLQRRSCSPATRGSLFANRSPKSDKNSEHSQQEDRYNFRSRSASFSTGRGSNEEEEVHFEFRASRIGKLGLLINSTPQTGPIVEQVKDYSTLFGRIRAGDRIVEVDGVETSHMSIKDVTKRLNGKYGIRTTTAEVRIKVARIRERDWGEEEESTSNGSESVDSFSSQHRRNHSDPEPLLDRLSLNSEHRISSYSYSNHSKDVEEV